MWFHFPCIPLLLINQFGSRITRPTCKKNKKNCNFWHPGQFVQRKHADLMAKSPSALISWPPTRPIRSATWPLGNFPRLPKTGSEAIGQPRLDVSPGNFVDLLVKKRRCFPRFLGFPKSAWRRDRFLNLYVLSLKFTNVQSTRAHIRIWFSPCGVSAGALID